MDEIHNDMGTDDSLTTFFGEVAILGSVSFSSRGIDFSKLKDELREFISDHRSDSDEWLEEAPSSEEKSQDVVWKMVHKHNKQDHASIRSVLRETGK